MERNVYTIRRSLSLGFMDFQDYVGLLMMTETNKNNWPDLPKYVCSASRFI